jgi:hypothetical protein
LKLALDDGVKKEEAIGLLSFQKILLSCTIDPLSISCTIDPLSVLSKEITPLFDVTPKVCIRTRIYTRLIVVLTAVSMIGTDDLIIWIIE